MQSQHLVIFFVRFDSRFFDQNIYWRDRCDSNKCFVLPWSGLYKETNYLSLNCYFVPLLKLMISTKHKAKRKHGHREKVGSLSKVQKKTDNVFLKEFLKNTETTEQDQNITLNWKEPLNPLLLKGFFNCRKQGYDEAEPLKSPKPFPFKMFPTNTMTKNRVFVSCLKLKQTESPTIKSIGRIYHQEVTKMISPNQTRLPN